MKTNRIAYVDIMKGVLIIMVMFGHLGALGACPGIELTHRAYRIRDYIACNMIAPFFMAAFFMVTGYCSNFRKSFVEQFYADFRRLIVPSFFINLIMISIIAVVNGEGPQLRDVVVLPWFIVALFIGKIFVKFFLEYCNSTLLKYGLFIILAFLGCFLWRTTWWLNLSSVPHAMAFSLFIFLGYEFRRKEIKTSMIGGGICAIVFLIFLLVFNLVLKRDLPALCALITFPWHWYPIYMATAVAETFIVYCVCLKINRNRFLEYFGRNSLIIYLTHSVAFFIFAKLIVEMGIDVNRNVVTAVLVMISMIAFGMIWGVLWIHILSLQGFKWIMGK